MKNVAIVYPYIPHYRVPVFEYIHRNSKRFRYTFFAGTNTIDTSIRNTLESNSIRIVKTPIFSIGTLTFQFGLARAILLGGFDHFIFLGDPHFITTWIYALVARLIGKRVWFWSHGWIKPESGLKRLIRNTFYRLANGLLLYGKRARQIGIESGFAPSKLWVIYNSLDYDKQSRTRARIENSNSEITSRSEFGECYFACISRLTNLCQLELAIQAIAAMSPLPSDRPSLVLIGAGPARQALESLGKELSVRVVFLGEVYDEDSIGPIIYNARAIVSPGKVGLTAMHSLGYGTPVITHGDLDYQMPEVESVIPGVTGDFFRRNDVSDLSDKLLQWSKRPRTSAERQNCIAIVESTYSPRSQLAAIETALSSPRT